MGRRACRLPVGDADLVGDGDDAGEEGRGEAGAADGQPGVEAPKS